MQAWADHMIPTVVNLLGWTEALFWDSTLAEIRRALDGWSWRWDRTRERDAWTVRQLWAPHVKKGARLPSIDEILGRKQSREEILKGSADVMREIGMPEDEIQRLMARRPKERPKPAGDSPTILAADGTPARGSIRIEES